jgi:voltage-gated potassium channel
MVSNPLAEAVLPFRALRNVSAYRLLHSAVLVVGVLALTAVSVSAMRARFEQVLSIALWSCFLFFSLEWIMRAWAGARAGTFIRYLFSAAGLIDALAVAPLAVAFVLGMPQETAWLLGSLWLLKLAPISPGLSLLGRVLALEAKPLASVMVIFLVILFLAAVALHVLERDAQPDKFGDLPGALWWSVATLTTTGYGDVAPLTRMGRLVASVVMVAGLGLFGLLTGILATGFVAEARRRDFVQNWDLVAQVPFFQCLDPKGIIEVTRMLRRLDVPERTTVVRRGRHGDCMYFVATGEVEVQVAPRPVRLGMGTFFGELALLGDGRRMATVVTRVPTTLLVLDLSDFRTLAAHYPEVARAVETEAERRRAEWPGGRVEAPGVAPQAVDSVVS